MTDIMKNKIKIGNILLAGMLLFSGCSTSTSEEEQYNSGYEKGYSDGLKANSIEPQTEEVEVKVSGDFTATVHDLIPDYCYDSETNRAAVVHFFKMVRSFLNWTKKCVLNWKSAKHIHSF